MTEYNSTGSLTVKEDFQNIGYILNDNSLFQEYQYRALLNSSGEGFVSCKKIMLNGHVKLVYNLSSLKPLQSVLNTLTPESFLKILSELIDIIKYTQSDGYLVAGNLAVDKIFLNEDLSVHVVYLPLSRSRGTAGLSVLEEKLNIIINDAYNTYANLTNIKTVKIRSLLLRGTLSLGDLQDAVISHLNDITAPSPEMDELSAEPEYSGKGDTAAFRKKIVSGFSGAVKKIADARNQYIKKVSPDSVSRVTLRGINTPGELEFLISQKEFVIGKNRQSVDGLIDFSKYVSKMHCRIAMEEDTCYITDLNSANGTFINGVRLKKDEKKTLANGDKVTLADITLQVHCRRV